MNRNIHLLMATQTGNAEDVAGEVRDALAEAGISVTWQDLAMTDKLDFLRQADCLLGVVSTWGEGEPPDDAVPFFESLRENAPLGLDGTPVAVLGLGDSGYDDFCECGKELERELIRHGGKVLIPRVDCDVWYEGEVAKWIADLLAALAPDLATREIR